MEFKNVKHVNPNELILNDEKFNILGTPKNYDELYNSIRQENILTPLLINESNIVISGNLRLIIALDLCLETVPVIYVNIHESDMVTILNTDINREKLLSEKLKIYFMLRKKYPIKKGVRTDLNKKQYEDKKEIEKLNPLKEHTEKGVRSMLKFSTPDQIIDSAQECERECENVKLPMVTKKLTSKLNQNDNGVNPKMESSIDYEKVFKNEGLREFVNQVNENGGAIFVTNVGSSKDWKLIQNMKKVGLILYTLKQITNNCYTYHFIFMKSSNPPVKHLDLHRNMTIVKSPSEISIISIDLNHRLAS
jgi:hypothetical protein